MSEGHPHARRYPLSRIWTEHWEVQRRVNLRIASEANLTYAALAKAWTGKGGLFDSLITKLTQEDR